MSRRAGLFAALLCVAALLAGCQWRVDNSPWGGVELSSPGDRANPCDKGACAPAPARESPLAEVR